ncbi:sialate O-acetylesterase [Sphingomonas quercus]|nr:sialate O-acetylesterase [Sphingomonas quercus]
MAFGWRRVPSAGGAVPPPPVVNPGYDVIVLAGESNIVGYFGPIDPVLDAPDTRIVQWSSAAQAVVPAVDPLDHPDQAEHPEHISTVGPGLSLAKAYIAAGRLDAGRQILLVPLGMGSTGFGGAGYWAAGGAGDLHAIANVNRAMAAGGGANRLACIAYSGGGLDRAMTASLFASHLDALVARWRGSMAGAAANTPFLAAGRLAGGANTSQPIIDALETLPNRVAYTAHVSAAGLVSGGDNIHLNAASQRTMGSRFIDDGLPAAIGNALAPALPSAPRGLAAVPATGQVALSWRWPAAGVPMPADYIVQYRPGGDSNWVTFADGVSDDTGALVTGLAGGLAYEFRVAARNDSGQGDWSSVVSATPGIVEEIAEADALRHWLYGEDNPGFVDLIGGETMTAASTVPTLHAGFMTTAGRNGGMCAEVTADASAMTIIVVGRPTAAALSGLGAAYAVNTRLSLAQGTALGMRGAAIADPNKFTFLPKPNAAHRVAVDAAKLASWCFMALSIAAEVRRIDYIGDAAGAIVSDDVNDGLTRDYAPTANRISAGDGYWNDSSAFTDPADIAELIVWHRALDRSELDAVYARSVARLAARGIALS